MGARSYLPTLGRFLSVDPVDGGSANPYDYVGQDPLNQLDLDGSCIWGKVVCRIASYFTKVKSLVPNSKFVRDLVVVRDRLRRVMKSPGGKAVGRILGGVECMRSLRTVKHQGPGDLFFTMTACAAFGAAVLAE